MLVAKNSQSIGVLAFEVDQRDKPFHCPKCLEEVVIRKGEVYVHHFAHKADSTCHHGESETPEHRDAKANIYKALRALPQVSNVRIEHTCAHTIADVYCEIDGCKLAIEIQLSDLSTVDLYRRTQAYTDEGIYVLWLLSPYLCSINARVGADVRDLYGTTYAYEHGLTILRYGYSTFSLLELKPIRSEDGYLLWNSTQANQMQRTLKSIRQRRKPVVSRTTVSRRELEDVDCNRPRKVGTRVTVLELSEVCETASKRGEPMVQLVWSSPLKSVYLPRNISTYITMRSLRAGLHEDLLKYRIAVSTSSVPKLARSFYDYIGELYVLVEISPWKDNEQFYNIESFFPERQLITKLETVGVQIGAKLTTEEFYEAVHTYLRTAFYDKSAEKLAYKICTIMHYEM